MVRDDWMGLGTYPVAGQPDGGARPAGRDPRGVASGLTSPHHQQQHGGPRRRGDRPWWCTVYGSLAHARGVYDFHAMNGAACHGDSCPPAGRWLDARHRSAALLRGYVERIGSLACAGVIGFRVISTQRPLLAGTIMFLQRNGS
jgi:hypothetical protein